MRPSAATAPAGTSPSSTQIAVAVMASCGALPSRPPTFSPS
ncbi:hypothetical protein E2C01_071608 [Portunus trituberculatus]|uniref:Uncharacterized protein n=1 Tax=Portunus trituberculatus TaxID=210409 RepID=A0A5B7I0C9_PORTR|nr:hypothetical protein [Portunus trituberculatus]